jgi:hypothetical protein
MIILIKSQFIQIDIMPKNTILFTQEEGAEAHCQSEANALSNQRIFDWVDEVFEYKPMS